MFFNYPTIHIIECISWIIKYLLLLTYGATMKTALLRSVVTEHKVVNDMFIFVIRDQVLCKLYFSGLRLLKKSGKYSETKYQIIRKYTRFIQDRKTIQTDNRIQVCRLLPALPKLYSPSTNANNKPRTQKRGAESLQMLRKT